MDALEEVGVKYEDKKTLQELEKYQAFIRRIRSEFSDK